MKYVLTNLSSAFQSVDMVPGGRGSLRGQNYQEETSRQSRNLLNTCAHLTKQLLTLRQPFLGSRGQLQTSLP